MRHRNLEVLIECDGRVLEEYNVQVKESIYECYIASEPDKVRRLDTNPSSQWL